MAGKSIVAALAMLAAHLAPRACAGGDRGGRGDSDVRKTSLRHLDVSTQQRYDEKRQRQRRTKKRRPKSGKATSSSGSGDRDLDSELERRYGFSMMSPAEMEENFVKAEGVYVTTYGLQNYNTPGFEVPLVDSFNSLGRVDLTWEEVQMMCVTKCDNSDVCQAVHVLSNGCACSFERGLKPLWECRMFNPELGAGAYQFGFDDPENSPPSVLYTKKSSTALVPPYEPCNVVVPDLNADIMCFLQGGECDLTQDFLDYIAPAAGCILQEGIAALGSGQGAVYFSRCLACTVEKGPYYDKGAAETCSVDPNISFIRGTNDGQCGEECYHIDSSTTLSEDCETKLQAALLCATGSIPTVVQGGFTGGGVNHPYVCPETGVF